jgi:hypothetical protein
MRLFGVALGRGALAAAVLAVALGTAACSAGHQTAAPGPLPSATPWGAINGRALDSLATIRRLELAKHPDSVLVRLGSGAVGSDGRIAVDRGVWQYDFTEPLPNPAVHSWYVSKDGSLEYFDAGTPELWGRPELPDEPAPINSDEAMALALKSGVQPWFDRYPTARAFAIYEILGGRRVWSLFFYQVDSGAPLCQSSTYLDAITGEILLQDLGCLIRALQ